MTSTEPLEPEDTSGSSGSSGPSGDSKLKAWLWALGGLVVVLLVVLAVVLITQDDDSDSASTTTTTSTTSPPSTTTTVAPTTTTSAPTTTTTLAPPTTTLPYPPITDDPQTYAEYLFVAWQKSADKTSAANVASAEAVDQIFAQPYSASSQWAFQMCNPAAGSLYCTWNGANNTKLLMTVRTLTGGLPIQVVMVQFQTA